MDERLALGLGERWWVTRRNRPPVQNALITAHSRYWRPLVQKTLAENRKQNRQPSSWADVAKALDIGEANLWRYRTGGHNLTTRDLLALASVVRLSLRQLVPDTLTWITETTLVLCGGPISAEEARAYTLYRLAGPTGHNPHLDRSAVGDILAQMSPTFPSLEAVEQAILKTADRLVERLMRRGTES